MIRNAFKVFTSSCVFIILFFMILSGFNLYCWKGIHFSENNFLIFLLLFQGLIYTIFYWFRDLLRELDKKYEVLLISIFLVFLLFIVSEGLLFVSFFWTSFHSFSSPTLVFCHLLEHSGGLYDWWVQRLLAVNGQSFLVIDGYLLISFSWCSPSCNWDMWAGIFLLLTAH